MQIQMSALNHMVTNFGPFNDWVGFFDVDEYFQLNTTLADAVESGNTTLPELLEAKLGRNNGSQYQAIQFPMWQVLDDLVKMRSHFHRHVVP